MAGALAALAGAGHSSTSGYTGTPGAVAWANISGLNYGSNGVQTMSGIVGAVSVTATGTGLGALLYTLNGVTSYYTGAFNWPEGQTLSWAIENDTTGGVAGTITVTNATAATTMATFTYSVRYSGGGGGIDP